MNVDRPLISAEIRAMVDNICYMSVYGHRSMFEKISVTRRAAFNNYTLKIAIVHEDEFYAFWSQQAVTLVTHRSHCSLIFCLRILGCVASAVSREPRPRWPTAGHLRPPTEVRSAPTIAPAGS